MINANLYNLPSSYPLSKNEGEDSSIYFDGGFSGQLDPRNVLNDTNTINGYLRSRNFAQNELHEEKYHTADDINVI